MEKLLYLIYCVIRDAIKKRKKACVKQTSDVECLGYSVSNSNGDDYDCEYPHAEEFGCEHCVVNGGEYDPRTGLKVNDATKGI